MQDPFPGRSVNQRNFPQQRDGAAMTPGGHFLPGDVRYELFRASNSKIPDRFIGRFN